MEILKPHRDASTNDAALEAREQRKLSDERSARVATWILVGNGAALLSCFNAVISGKLDNWEPLRPFAFAFWLGIVCAVVSVVLQGEARDSVTRRLMLTIGATRRAAICTDANDAFVEARAKGMHWDAEVAGQVEENVRQTQEAIAEIEKLRDDTFAERALFLTAKALTVIAALCFAIALLVAIVGGAVEKVITH